MADNCCEFPKASLAASVEKCEKNSPLETTEKDVLLKLPKTQLNLSKRVVITENNGNTRPNQQNNGTAKARSTSQASLGSKVMLANQGKSLSQEHLRNQDNLTTSNGITGSQGNSMTQGSLVGVDTCSSPELLNTDPTSVQNGVEEKNADANSTTSDDPTCDPDRPTTITFEDVASAAYKIKDGITNSPCLKSHMSQLTGMDIYLKKDFLQHTGSFKERGARYAMTMLSEEKKRKGVVAASLGNHAQAVSYHGQLLNIPVTVVMPVIAPIMKIQKCREFQANVVIEGKDMEEAIRAAHKLSKEQGLTYINGYDNPQIIAGQGTIALEIMEQVENIDAIIVPTGGGGLLAGVGVAVKTLNPQIKLIGVESERCASFARAMEAGRPVKTVIEGTLADGLAVQMVGYNAWKTSKDLVDKMVVVKEEYIAIAILRLVELEKCVVEGAGAAGLAAILAGQLDEFKGKRVVLILSGGNIDTTILGRCLERGLAADGRLVKLKVTVSDRPGGISELCKLIGSIGVSIKDVIHERAWVTSDVFSVEVKVVCETRDFAHSMELKKLLNSKYKQVKFDNPNPPPHTLSPGISQYNGEK